VKAKCWEVICDGGINYVEFSLDDAKSGGATFPSIPTLIIDGAAREVALSANGEKLRVLISGAEVGNIRHVTTPELLLRSEHKGKSQKPSQGKKRDNSSVASITDPFVDGEFGVIRHDYDYGDLSLFIPRLNRMVECRAAVYLPDSEGVYPVVVFLHGVGVLCTGGPDSVWPCGDGYEPVPSHAGYSSIAEALASHGYAVVSVSAVGVMRLTIIREGYGDLAYLLIAHLDLLREANSGLRPELSYLQGKLDLQNIGLVGHSFGGEGVARSVTLNRLFNKNYGIRAVVLLASSAVSELTIPGTHTAIILPYLDGQVRDLRTERSAEVSRYAFNDEVLRSTILLISENHNFFNTQWSPGAPFGWDDARRDTNLIRHRPIEVQRIGAFYILNFFRLAIGGEQQFLPLFDGSSAIVPFMPRADTRTYAYFPTSSRYIVQSFETLHMDDPLMAPGDWDWVIRQGVGEIKTGYPPGYVLGYAYSMFHSYLHLRGEGVASPAELLLRPRLSIPPVDLSLYTQLRFHVAVLQDENPEGVELSLVLGDATLGLGQSRRRLQLLPERSPGDKLFLHQQVTVPLEEFSIDLSRPVDFLSFTLPNGGSIYLSDIMFVTPALGQSSPLNLPFFSFMDDTPVHATGEEQELEVVAHLSDVSSSLITIRVDFEISHRVLGSMRFNKPMKFSPGELTTAVTFLIPAGGFRGTDFRPGDTYSGILVRAVAPTNVMLNRDRMKFMVTPHP